MTRRAAALVLAWCAFGACGPGCKDAEQPSEVLLVVAAERGIRADAVSLHLDVRGQDSTPLDKTFSNPSWPVTLGIVPKSGDAKRTFRATAEAVDADGHVIATARVLTGFVAHEKRYAYLLLEDACREQACADDTTCHAGACGDANVAPRDLPTKRPATPGSQGAMDAGGGDGASPEGGVSGGGGAGGSGGSGGGGSGGNPAGDAGRDDGGKPTGPAKPGAACDADDADACVGNAMCNPASSRCECASGYQAKAGACTDIDECTNDHGGCDAQVECNNTAGSWTCGDCPAGYTGGGAQGCTPKLLGLLTNADPLVPAFDPNTTEYTLFVPLVMSEVAITPTAPDGASVKIDGESATSGEAWTSAAIATGDSTIAIDVAKSDGSAKTTYTLHVTRGEQKGYLKASTPAASDQFGLGVAIDGDTLVVGTYQRTAYVFTRQNGAWMPQAELHAEYCLDAGDNNPHFGQSVAIDGDTIVIGVPSDWGVAHGVNHPPSSCPKSVSDPSVQGAAYIFERSGTSWTRTAYLKPCADGGAFGQSVAISGGTVIVGAPDNDSDATGIVNSQTCSNSGSLGNSGAAFVFVKNGASWVQQAYVKPSDAAMMNARFATSVSVSGDTALAGPYVLTRSGSSWSHQTKLSVSGYAAAIDGDTLVLADLQDTAYVFVNDSGSWTQQDVLPTNNGGVSVLFGQRVSISGDAIAIGAYWEQSSSTGINGAVDHTAYQAGAAWLFTRKGTAWSQQAFIKASNAEAYDGFGIGVGISGDTIVVGAQGEASNGMGSNPQADNSAMSAGAAYVFR